MAVKFEILSLFKHYGKYGRNFYPIREFGGIGAGTPGRSIIAVIPEEFDMIHLDSKRQPEVKNNIYSLHILLFCGN